MKFLPLLIVATTACSSAYFPRSRARLSMIMKDGSLAYVRDGRVFEAGMFGGGLADAVQGVPAAVDAANTFHDRMVGGFVGLLLTSVCLGGSTVWATNQAVEDRSAEPALLGMAACSVGMIASAAWMGSAAPYQWDAINVFNDSVDPH